MEQHSCPQCRCVPGSRTASCLGRDRGRGNGHKGKSWKLPLNVRKNFVGHPGYSKLQNSWGLLGFWINKKYTRAFFSPLLWWYVCLRPVTISLNRQVLLLQLLPLKPGISWKATFPLSDWYIRCLKSCAFDWESSWFDSEHSSAPRRAESAQCCDATPCCTQHCWSQGTFIFRSLTTTKTYLDWLQSDSHWIPVLLEAKFSVPTQNGET